MFGWPKLMITGLPFCAVTGSVKPFRNKRNVNDGEINRRITFLSDMVLTPSDRIRETSLKTNQLASTRTSLSNGMTKIDETFHTAQSRWNGMGQNETRVIGMVTKIARECLLGNRGTRRPLAPSRVRAPAPPPESTSRTA